MRIVKIFAFIVLCLIPILFYAQNMDTKKLEAYEKELEQIEKRIEARGGIPTPQDEARAWEISIEIMMMSGYTREQAEDFLNEAKKNAHLYEDQPEIPEELQRQIREQQEALDRYQQFLDNPQITTPEPEKASGETQGWASRDILQKFDLSALRQPTGTQASYTDYGSAVNLYLQGDNNEKIISDLIKDINNLTKKQMQQNPTGEYQVYVEQGTMSGYTITIGIENSAVRVNLRQSIQ